MEAKFQAVPQDEGNAVVYSETTVESQGKTAFRKQPHFVVRT